MEFTPEIAATFKTALLSRASECTAAIGKGCDPDYWSGQRQDAMTLYWKLMAEHRG